MQVSPDQMDELLGQGCTNTQSPSPGYDATTKDVVIVGSGFGHMTRTMARALALATLGSVTIAQDPKTTNQGLLNRPREDIVFGHASPYPKHRIGKGQRKANRKGRWEGPQGSWRH